MASYAGVAMAMSSVTVVGNSILLGRYKSKFVKGISDREKEIYTNVNLRAANPLHYTKLQDNHSREN